MIKMKNVNKAYDGKSVLKNISVDFPKGETSVIVGPSGSGKSTLLRSIDLLVHPESGIIVFPDLKVNYAKPISKKDSKKLREKTSMVFQNWNLFPNLTVLKNVTLAPIHVQKIKREKAEADARRLLQKVGLEKYADYYPSQLSGGMQQRISICRALAVKPEYILLDEPTSALDPELETQVLKLLEDLAKEGQSLIMITHNMQFAKAAADKIVFIEDGSKLFDGETSDFFDKPTPRIKQFLQGISLK